jgi:hypothetical protein
MQFTPGTKLDKVKIKTPIFNLTQVDTFGISSHNKQPNEPISESICARMSNGKDVIGQNIYIVSKDIPYHLDISPNYNGVIQSTLTFNPGHFKSLPDAINTIDSNLKNNHKFEFDFWSSMLSRLDIAKDKEMENFAMAYTQGAIPHLIRTRYYKDGTSFPTSVLYKTRGWQISGYDKGLKILQDEGYKTIQPTKDLRTELRLLNPSYILKHLGFSNFETLIELNESDLDKLFVGTTKKFIKELKLKNEPMECISDVLEYIPLLMKERSRELRILKYLAMHDLSLNDSLLTRRRNYMEAINYYLQQKEFSSRQAKSNWKNREFKALDEKLREINLLQSKTTRKIKESMKDKIEEYQYKFLTA